MPNFVFSMPVVPQHTRFAGLLTTIAFGLLASGCSSSPSQSAVAATTRPVATPTATPTLAPTPTPTPSIARSGNYASATEAGIAGAQAKTGLTYPQPPSACPAGQSCLSNPRLFGNDNTSLGLDAAYIQIDAAGSGGGAVCNVYVFYDSAGWHYLPPVVCPTAGGYNPVLGTADHVNVPGDCANVRSGPGLSYKVVTCIKDGTTVTIDTFFPRYTDGHIWWSINHSQGWMAHDFLITQ